VERKSTAQNRLPALRWASDERTNPKARLFCLAVFVISAPPRPVLYKPAMA